MFNLRPFKLSRRNQCAYSGIIDDRYILLSVLMPVHTQVHIVITLV